MDERSCVNCKYECEDTSSIHCLRCLSVNESGVHHNNWTPKEKPCCNNCGHKNSPSLHARYCTRCTASARPDGTMTKPTHWVPTEDDQKYVDTDSIKPLSIKNIPSLTVDWERTIDRNRAKEILNSVYGYDPEHEDRIDSMFYTASRWDRNSILKELGKFTAAGIQSGLNSMNDALVEYCRNDVKASMECFNKLKEETMPTGRTAYNLFFDTLAYSRPTFPGLPGIKKVIFSNPCTIVLWDDGTKTMVRAQGKERFDREKGLAMAIAKKALGNKGNYYDTFTEHLSKPVAKKKSKKK